MKKNLKWKIILVFLFIILIIFISARYIGTKGLIIREYKIENNKIPKSFYGLKIAHFSDLHYGMSVNENTLSNLVNTINATKPDIVLFTGDLIDKNTKFTEELKSILIKYLSKIKSTYGNYYVSGDHDLYMNSYNLLMTNSNFKSLDNSYDIIENLDNSKIFIGGVNVKLSNNNFDDILLNNEYNYKILLMHYPDNYDNVRKYEFDLILSGHSHNGQVRLPSGYTLIKSKNATKYYNEYYKINNTDFYISGGIGNSTLNLRLFTTPSFNLYRLVDK